MANSPHINKSRKPAQGMVHRFAEQNAERILEIVSDPCADMQGICVICGDEPCSPVEPDARNYKCECCESLAVFGAQELLFYI